MAIPLIGPDGAEYELDDPANLEKAKALGYREATAEAPQTFGEEARAFGHDVVEKAGAAGEGAVQGLTAGLYGAAIGRKKGAGESEEDYGRRRFEADELQRRKEENPELHLAGELGGALLSPVNKVGTAITKGIGATTALGRIGANVVGGSGVGSLFGAGNTLSDAALGNHDLTAEKLFAGVGMGAMLGGAGAGLGGSLEEAVGVLAPKIGKAVAGADLGEWANSRALKAAGATQKDLNYLGEDKAKAVGQMLIERGHLGKGIEAPNAAGVLKSVQAEKEALGAQLGQVFDDAAAVGARPEYSKVLRRLDDFEAGLSPLERKAISTELQETREAVQEIGLKPASDLEGGFKALNKLKQDLQAKAKWGDNVGQEFKGGLKRQLSGIVREELDTQITSHMHPDLAPKFLDMKKLYGQLADAERIAEHGAERLGGNASFGLRDLGIGAAAGLGHGNPVTGIVSAIASKVMRERGQGVIARLADSIAKSPRLSVAAQSFGKQLPAAAPLLGRYAPLLERAFATSPAVALATHMTWAQADPEYSHLAQTAGFLPETPEENAAAMGRAGTIAGVASLLQQHDAEVDRGIDKMLKGKGTPPVNKTRARQDFGAKRMRRDDAEAHQQRMQEIRALSASPEQLVDRVTANLGQLGEQTPGVTAAVTRTAHLAVSFLAQATMEPPKAGPLAPEWVPTNAQRHQFSQTLETVEDPMSVLKHAAAGTLTENHVRALRTVYPQVAQQIADKALERIAGNPKAVPYKSRLMLFMLTGVDVDGTFNPAAVARNQAAIHSSQQQNTGAPQPPGERKSEQTLASRVALPNQRAEMNDGGGNS